MKRNVCAALTLSLLIFAGCQDNPAQKETPAATVQLTEESVPAITEIDPTAAVNEPP